jgi:hypothetical protein
MEQTSQETPRRVTPTEARAKLLRSLVSQPEQRMKIADREKLENLQLSYLRELAEQP